MTEPQPAPHYQQPPQPAPHYQQPPQPAPQDQQVPHYQQPAQAAPHYQQVSDEQRRIWDTKGKRGMGFGWMLAEAALNRARTRGCRRVFLVTENASDFFAEKLGFKKVERAMVDASVLESSQFGFDIEKAVTMVRDLD